MGPTNLSAFFDWVGDDMFINHTTAKREKQYQCCKKGYEAILFFECKGSFHNNLVVIMKQYPF
jgi:hypothetical protein